MTRKARHSLTIICTPHCGLPVITKAVGGLWRKRSAQTVPFWVPSAFLPNAAAGIIFPSSWDFRPIGRQAYSLCMPGQHRPLVSGHALDFKAAKRVCCRLSCVHSRALPIRWALAVLGRQRPYQLNFKRDPRKKHPRPFDKQHDGFVRSKGAATVIIERLSHARKARPQFTARNTGCYGTSGRRLSTLPQVGLMDWWAFAMNLP